MLRMIQNQSPVGAKSYYSTADYYMEGQELTGRWRGEGARRLGLFGDIRKADWDALCDNKHPDTGEPLTPRRKLNRTVGYDLNFHVPKSVSVLYGLTQDERILETFRESVDATMRDIESEMQTRVRASGQNQDRVTGNMVWGEYVHLTSRPVDGKPDPHLHAHCFVFNQTWDDAESRWKAGQFRELKRDTPYFEAMFHARLARGMQELGLPVVRTRKGWELAGVSTSINEKFSRRTAVIEAEAKERGIADPQAKGELGAKTREKKQKGLAFSELQSEWASRLTDDERDSLARVKDRIGQAAIPEDPGRATEAVAQAIEHVFERCAVVPERKLLADALRRAYGAASPRTVADQVARANVLTATRHGRRMVTTREVLAEEQAMIAFAREGRGACRPINPGRDTFNRDWLNTQQKAAVRHLLQSRDRVMVIRGAAGTGKTTMMQEAKEAIEEVGLQVHAFAPSADASRGVLRDEGFTSADTVARLLADPKIQEQARDGVIWIDEAGLVGSRTMREVFQCAERVNARVVLSGDRRQHGSVERGAALRLLEDEAGVRPAEIKEIQRQQGEYKAAVKDLSDGRVREGFQRLDQLGWIREVNDDDREQALAEAYLESVREKKSALVISPTHAEGDAITQEIRRQMREQHMLGAEQHQFERLAPTNLTLGEREDAVNYEPGDVLVFHQNAKGFVKGQRVVVGVNVGVGEEPVPLEQAERFTVFRPKKIELAVGDRIRITKNGKAASGRRNLNNGDRFIVKEFARSGNLVVAPLDEKRGRERIEIPKDYGHLDYGLVITSHASQGKTVSRVFVAQSSQSLPAASREQFYVSVSRGREQVLVFTNDKSELRGAVEQGDERIAAMDLFVRDDTWNRGVALQQARSEQIDRIPIGQEVRGYERSLHP